MHSQDTFSNSIIRPVQPSDRADVLKIAHTSGLFPPDELDEIAATLDRYLTGAAPHDRWILCVDDGPAGVAYYAPEHMTNGTWNLFMLAVEAQQHRRGHGANLVRYVEDDLLTSGQGRLLLIETSGVPQFAGQRTFYTSLGYQLEAQIRDFYDLGDDKFIYLKRSLPPTGRPKSERPR